MKKYCVIYKGEKRGAYSDLRSAVDAAAKCGEGARVIGPDGHWRGSINARGRLELPL